MFYATLPISVRHDLEALSPTNLGIEGPFGSETLFFPLFSWWKFAWALVRCFLKYEHITEDLPRYRTS